LQVIERGHLAVTQDEELAVERHLRRDRIDNFRKRCADLVSGARIEPSLGAAGDELDANPIPFPLGKIVAGIEVFEFRIL